MDDDVDYVDDSEFTVIWTVPPIVLHIRRISAAAVLTMTGGVSTTTAASLSRVRSG